jgi:hypothetical protein
MLHAITYTALMFLPILTTILAQPIPVSDDASLRAALAAAAPGHTITLAPGAYTGGLSTSNLQGTPTAPITITAADLDKPPLIKGGGSAFHLTDAAHVTISHLIIESATGNGINIDDGGSYDTPAHHITLTHLTIRDIGPAGSRGNCDGIKLSGVDDFTIDRCTIEKWGSGGSGVDMVGCHRGRIAHSTFRHTDEGAANGVQAKGGSEAITIEHCLFDHAGQRALNLGGSTGQQYFRFKNGGTGVPPVRNEDGGTGVPPVVPSRFEARYITVEDCTIIGSLATIAFVGVDGAVVRHNTIYRPRKWLIRILQETRDPAFIPCRDGAFTDNLIIFRSEEMATAVNVGPDTAPDSFTLARNAWYCEDDPARSRPRLQLRETESRYGVDPLLADPSNGDLTTKPESPFAGPNGPGVRPPSNPPAAS